MGVGEGERGGERERVRFRNDPESKVYQWNEKLSVRAEDKMLLRSFVERFTLCLAEDNKGENKTTCEISETGAEFGEERDRVG